MIKNSKIYVWSYLSMMEIFYHKNFPITLCACNIRHKYHTTITDWYYQPYYISASTYTALNYLHIAITIVKITVQHSAFLAEGALSPYALPP